MSGRTDGSEGTPPEPAISVKTVMMRAAVSYQTVLNDIKSGVLPAYKIPWRHQGRYRVPEAAVPAYVEQKAKRRQRGLTGKTPTGTPMEDEAVPRTGEISRGTGPPRDGDTIWVRGRSYEVVRADDTGFVAVIAE